MALGHRSAILEKIQAHKFQWTGPEPIGASVREAHKILAEAIAGWLRGPELIPVRRPMPPWWNEVWYP